MKKETFDKAETLNIEIEKLKVLVAKLSHVCKYVMIRSRDSNIHIGDSGVSFEDELAEVSRKAMYDEAVKLLAVAISEFDKLKEE